MVMEIVVGKVIDSDFGIDRRLERQEKDMERVWCIFVAILICIILHDLCILHFERILRMLLQKEQVESPLH